MISTHVIPYSVLRDKLVHIVDADLNTCEALSVLFRLEGFETAFSQSTAEFLLATSTRPPNIVIMNFSVDGGTGLSLLKQCRSLYKGIPVVMLTDKPDMDAAVEAMKLGSCEVIAKPINHEWLISVVRDTVRRDVHVGVEVDGQRSVEIKGFSNLTPREREVLQLIVDGKSNKSSARDLGISPRTIEVHRGRVMEKLGAKNAVDLMRIILMR